MGVRRLRPAREIEAAGDDAPLTYDSRVDKFDLRHTFLKGARRGSPGRIELDELRHISMYEFL